jgi:sugar lactone lactonase YvrE
MTLTKRTQHKFSGALLASALFLLAPACADDYRDARAELIAAYQQEDFPAMLVAANNALAARPGFPGAIFNLAMTQAVNGDPEASLQTLETLLKKGIDFGAGELDQFAAVRELDGWSGYEVKVDALHMPFGTADVVTIYDDADFVPEGIAFDNEGQLYLGSIHRGQIIRLGESVEVLSDRDTHWSAFGSRFHSDGSLWFASAAVPQMAGVGEDEGKTGLFRLDVSSGMITKSAILPQYENSQVLGDLIIADDNTIYATDSLTGAIYRYYIDSNEFEILVRRGKLGSPQGLVLDTSRTYLYVADYIGGLYRVWLQDGSLDKLDIADDTTAYGIDGLYRYGDELVVIQNGIRPNRVAALQLSENGLAITSSRLLAANLEQFDEPTLGVIRSDDFYFVANSHWNRFDRENELPKGLSGPIILRLSLD